LPLTRETIDSVNGLKHLQHLEIRNCTIDTADLACQPFLLHIPALGLAKIEIWERSVTSWPPHLVCRLSDFTSVHWHQADLMKLRSCPQLRRIELMNEAGLDPLIVALTKMPGLQEVFLVDTVPKAEQIRMIVACPNIRRLILTRAALTAQDLQRCALYGQKIAYED